MIKLLGVKKIESRCYRYCGLLRIFARGGIRHGCRDVFGDRNRAGLRC